MSTTESLYRDSMIAWLRNRSYYPWDNTPEPPMPAQLDHELTEHLMYGPAWLLFGIQRHFTDIRADVIRDFQRGEEEDQAGISNL